jgi:outer membrane lipoprotein-sorting protein
MVLFLRTICGALGAFLVCCSVLSPCQQPTGNSSQSSSQYSGQSVPLSGDQVAKKLEENDRQRAAALEQFSSQRIYRMHYHGFAGDYEAQMVVEATYRAPNTKQFKVVSQSGSTFVINHVFKRLMESEQEFISDQNRQQTALNTENYTFSLIGYDPKLNGGEYVLDLSPRKKNRFLYRGKIWVDAKDFAVVRIEAQPSENPSLWIKKTEIEHKYMKQDGFWLPAWDHTESQMRLGGEATLSIEYKDYHITKTTSSHGLESARAGSR